MYVHVAVAVVCLYQNFWLTGKPIHIILCSTTYSNCATFSYHSHYGSCMAVPLIHPRFVLQVHTHVLLYKRIFFYIICTYMYMYVVSTCTLYKNECSIYHCLFSLFYFYSREEDANTRNTTTRN